MASLDDPPFSRIAIVGLGLIGGSVALGVRERWPSARLVGLDRPSVLAHVMGSGALDRAVERMADIGDPDLLILAAPVRQNVRLLEEVRAHLVGATVVTDVGGTKREIVAAAQSMPSMTFVGGHPIGGAEQGGFAFAGPHLFKGRPWIFTPDPATPADTVERVYCFARGLGARPSTMTADDHDRAMAFLSHLPQLTASALMEVIGREATSDGLRLAGRGLVDTTRLASSPPNIWQDICASNADAIGEALDSLIARLTELRADLRRGQAMAAIFEEAARWRAELMKGRE